jgi:hypothetical protein
MMEVIPAVVCFSDPGCGTAGVSFSKNDFCGFQGFIYEALGKNGRGRRRR